MEQRPLGNTGITVSCLGFGAGSIGEPGMSEPEAAHLLNSVLDLGINLIDTARSYGLSEERIGRHLSHRRQEFILSTKVGYGVPGIPDWTGPCITAGIDQALRFLQTDRIDIVHLHSCPLQVLQQEEITGALQKALQEGKILVAAYSGDNEPAQYAVDSGKFKGLQLSMNICDQNNLPIASSAKSKGIGVIAKRSLANAVWTWQSDAGNDAAATEYRKRWQILERELPDDLPPDELALRFVLSLEEVDCCLIGTRRSESLRQNAANAAKGKLAPDLVTDLRALFRKHGENWSAMI